MMLAIAFAFATGLFLLGFFLPKVCPANIKVSAAWIVTIFSVVLMKIFVSDLAPGTQMMALIFALFLGMKAVAVCAMLPRGMTNFQRWTLFSLGWVGMSPLPFERNNTQLVSKRTIIGGFISILIGLGWLAVVCFLLAKSGPSLILLIAAFPAFIFIFHGGIFHLLAAFYQGKRIAVTEVMDYPISSRSLNEFWSKRWNIVFIGMLRQSVFLPVARKYGSRSALLISFLVSGLLHEVALSLPVNKGFGFPTLYFLIQALLIMAERHFLKGKMGRLLVIFSLLIPLPLLFHPAFLQEIMQPFLQQIISTFS